jgi:hypothetical protein
VVDAMVAILRRLGWIVDVEVSFSVWGERRSNDILAFHPLFGALLVVEVKSVVADSQATLHGLDRKARLARDIVKDRAWRIRHVSRLLVIGASATSRRRIARLGATYDAALPARGTTVRRWLVRPAEPLDGLLFLAIDSHGGTTRRSPGRERVRRRRQGNSGRSRNQSSASLPNDANSSVGTQRVDDTASVAVE